MIKKVPSQQKKKKRWLFSTKGGLVNGGSTVSWGDETLKKVLQYTVWQIRLCHLICNTGAYIITKRITNLYEIVSECASSLCLWSQLRAPQDIRWKGRNRKLRIQNA